MTGDAGADASPDAQTAGDMDQDGVPDAVDDCPTVYDPAQVDPDQDGVGWACDSQESFELAVHNPTVFPPKLVGKTFALNVAYVDDQSAWQHIVAQIDLTKFTTARSDSGLPADAWLEDAQIEGPCITADEHVWWSRRDHLETGTLTTATGVFTPAAPLTITTCTEAAGATALLGLTSSSEPVAQPIPTSLAVPIGTSLSTIATASPGFEAQDQPAVRVTAKPETITLVAKTTASTYSLMQEHVGDLAPTEVLVDGAPATNLDEVVPLDIPPGLEPGPEPVASYCVRRGAAVYHLGVAQSAVTWAPLPFSVCPAAALRLPDSRAHFLRGTQAVGTTSIVRILDGDVMTVVDNEPGDLLSAYEGGDNLQTVKLYEGQITKVWAVGSSSVLLASTLQSVSTSTYRDTIHVIGIQPTTAGLGDLVLVRYRASTGRQQLTIQTGIPISLTPKVATTAEGGAIVGGSGEVYAVGRTSTGVMPLGFSALDLAAARGDTTMLAAHTHASGFQSVIYAYDELGGSPRVTALTGNIDAGAPMLLDPYFGLATDWFTWGVVCTYGHIVYANNVPTLQHASNCQPGGRVVGRTTAGIPVLISVGLVALLEPTGPVTVMHFPGLVSIVPIVDFRYATPPVLGWYGGQTACLASHPERCWRLHGSIIFPFAAHSEVDTFALMSFADLDNGQYRVDVIRAIDEGQVAQPL